jgi:hypothetical protein
MIKKILIGLLALVLILVLVGFMLSQHYEASRSIVIHAPAEKVFPLIGDLRNWSRWDPFQEVDRTIVTTLGEKTTGIGASQSWQGSSGGGRLVFTECDPSTGVSCDMVFFNGSNEAPAKCWFRPAALPDGTVELEWGINGEWNIPVVGGYLAKFSDSPGPLLQRGLEKIKLLAETGPP